MENCKNEKVLCECGSMISKKNIGTHSQTKKHLKGLEQKKDQGTEQVKTAVDLSQPATKQDLKDLFESLVEFLRLDQELDDEVSEKDV